MSNVSRTDASSLSSVSGHPRSISWSAQEIRLRDVVSPKRGTPRAHAHTPGHPPRTPEAHTHARTSALQVLLLLLLLFLRMLVLFTLKKFNTLRMLMPDAERWA